MNELILLSNNIFVSYKDSQLSNVHPYFRRHHEYNTCVNGMCREKRLGYIYIKLLKPNSGIISFDGVWHLYIKRKVPYCIGCFKYNYLLDCDLAGRGNHGDVFLFHPQGSI